MKNGVNDVIVVGVGPSGAMAARTIAKKGYSVLVIDKKKEVGRPIQCAEAISESALKNNGLRPVRSWIKSQQKGIKIFAPNGKYFLSNIRTYSIDRTRFDKWLIKEAVDNGCKVKLNTNVDKVERNNNKNWVIKTNKGVFKSKILIAADGPNSNIASQLGLLKNKESIPAIQYKFKSVDFPENKFLCMFFDEKYRKGYIWVFPRGDELNVGVAGSGKVKEWLDDFCKSKKFDIKKRVSINSGIIPKKYILESFVKDNVLIVGDAAGLTNPIFGGGIHSALFSGRVAGETICDALASKDLALLEKYDIKLRNSLFCKKILWKGDKIFYSFTNKEFNFFGDVFNGREWTDVSYFEIFQKFLANPRFLTKALQFWTVREAIDISGKCGC